MSRIDKRFIKFGTGTNEVNIDVVPDGTTRMALTNDVQTIAGVKTFSSLPVASAEPTLDGQLTNRAWVLAQLESKVHGLTWRAPVDGMGATNPDTPTVGQRFINTTDNKVYECVEAGVWNAGDAPAANWTMLLKSEDRAYTFDADTSAWVAISASILADATKSSKGKVQVGDGIAVASGIISLDVATNSGLELTGTSPDQQLAAKVDTTTGLEITARGIAVNLQATNPTLQVTEGELGVKVKTAGGLLVDADGLSVDPAAAIDFPIQKHVTITLSAQNITDKYVDLSETVHAAEASSVQVVPAGGPVQTIGVDFELINNGSEQLRRLSWNGLWLDGVVEAGDVLNVWYAV